MRNLKEMDALEAYLKERGVNYERFDNGPEFAWKEGNKLTILNERHQICVPSDKHREWDVVCHNYSYGAEDGLLELMCKKIPGRSAYDCVEGYLSAEDTIELLKSIYGEESAYI